MGFGKWDWDWDKGVKDLVTCLGVWFGMIGWKWKWVGICLGGDLIGDLFVSQKSNLIFDYR